MSRPQREAVERVINAFLDKAEPGCPEFHLIEDGDEGWAFWIEPEDTTSYVHPDLRIEWYGSGWRNAGVPVEQQQTTEDKNQ